MTVIFESDRLLFRLFTMADAELVYRLNNDPLVTRFTHDPINSLEQAREVLEGSILPQYAVYNHGRWAVHLRHGLEFIGWCGLKYRHEHNEIDLGYRFAPASWGKGYATEAAFSCIRHGFEKLGMEKIVGRAEPGNLASTRVLEKCGMHYIGDQIVDGHPARTYIIYNPLIQ